LGLGRSSGGRRGAMTTQSSSSRSGFAMPTEYPGRGFC
jgi:hypothetical protein